MTGPGSARIPAFSKPLTTHELPSGSTDVERLVKARVLPGRWHDLAQVKTALVAQVTGKRLGRNILA
jgi:hypothetical protein